MNRCLLRVAMFLLTSPAWSQVAVQPVETNLCELYQHPEQYAGRMVKVRGGSVNSLNIEDILHDTHQEPCPAYLSIIVVFPSQVRPAPDFELIRDESFKRLEEALNSSTSIRIDATYEGRFDPVFAWRDHKRSVLGARTTGYGKKHEYDARIVLRQVSDVWTIPLPHK